jgi:ribosomal silencing factor RsfS
MIFTAEHYSKLLTDNGILIIEDVQSMEWVDDIISSFPKKLQKNVKVVDLRHIKGRYDDILIICTITPQQVKTAVDESSNKCCYSFYRIHYKREGSNVSKM